MTDNCRSLSDRPSGVKVLGGAFYVDGKDPMGVKVQVDNDGGWLKVEITADEGIVGYMVSVNGRSLT